jgi:hypothetical protein
MIPTELSIVSTTSIETQYHVLFPMFVLLNYREMVQIPMKLGCLTLYSLPDVKIIIANNIGYLTVRTSPA